MIGICYVGPHLGPVHLKLWTWVLMLDGGQFGVENMLTSLACG